MTDTNVDLTNVAININSNCLYIAGFCENGERVTVEMPLDNLQKISISPERSVTHIDIHWPIRK